jgi:hypothetical protein
LFLLKPRATRPIELQTRSSQESRPFLATATKNSENIFQMYAQKCPQNSVKLKDAKCFYSDLYVPAFQSVLEHNVLLVRTCNWEDICIENFPRFLRAKSTEKTSCIASVLLPRVYNLLFRLPGIDHLYYTLAFIPFETTLQIPYGVLVRKNSSSSVVLGAMLTYNRY